MASTANGPLPQPDSRNASLWRYLDLPKLVWMLENKALHYCQLKQLDDQHEGRMPQGAYGSLVAIWRKLQQDAGVPDAEDPSLSMPHDYVNNFLRSCFYVNCWCMHDEESDALWRIYAYPNGIAIKSQYHRLALATPQEDVLGRVTYAKPEAIDINDGSILRIAGWKRPYFQFEHEVRLIRMGATSNTGKAFSEFSSGISVPIKLEDVIISIHVSPYSDLWFFETVERLVKRYSLDVPVLWSDIR